MLLHMSSLNHPNLDPAVAAPARVRLKSGRNETCPCGSGRKYKKCCLANDEALVRHVDIPARTEATEGVSSPPPLQPLPPRAPKEPRPLSETESKRNALWDAFDALKAPTAAQMDDLLDNLLVLPHDATDWADAVHVFASHGHPELPAVFRRIAGAVPHTQGTEMAYFYWAAAEEFARKKLVMPLRPHKLFQIGPKAAIRFLKPASAFAVIQKWA
jgi:hypothetical protein